MLLHDFGNSHAVCFNLLFISFDFTVALRDLALQQSDSAQCVFLLGRKLNGRQPGLTFSVDTGQRFKRQLRRYTGHCRRLIMLKAPYPFVETLENHIFLGFIPGDIRNCQVVVRVVSPDCGERTDVDISNGQVETQLQFIVQRNGTIAPLACFMIGTAFALQDTGLSVRGTLKTPIEVGKRIRMVCVLVQVRVLIHAVSGFLGIPMCCDRFKQMPHLKLIGVAFCWRLHPSLFDHPQLQRRCPRGDPEDGCHITAADCIRDFTGRSVHTGRQPLGVGHSGSIA